MWSHASSFESGIQGKWGMLARVLHCFYIHHRHSPCPSETFVTVHDHKNHFGHHVVWNFVWKSCKVSGRFWCQILHHSLALVQPYMITLITPQAYVTPCATFTSARKNMHFTQFSKTNAPVRNQRKWRRHISISSSSGMSPCITKLHCNMFPKKLKAVGFQRNGTHRAPGNLFHSSKYSQGTDQLMDHSATLSLRGVNRSEDHRRFHNIYRTPVC